MAAYKFLNAVTVRAISEALTPQFLGESQKSLTQAMDELAFAVEDAIDLTAIYQFMSDIQGMGGADLVGITDLGGFYTATTVEDALQQAATPAWNNITGKPLTFPPSAHVHPIAEVTGLQTALDGKAPLNGVGTSGTWPISVTGNAGTATQLATGRNFSLTGVVTAGAVSFNGTANVALSTAIADGALSIAKTSGLQAALDAKLTGTYPANTTTFLRGDGTFSSTTTGSWSFGSATRQMLNLFGTVYGVGVQASTQYYRSGGGYAWFLNGVHSDTTNDPGAGGTLLARINSTGDFFARDVYANRTGGDGYIFFNSAGTRYLGWNGSNYVFNAGNLTVNGDVSGGYVYNGTNGTSSGWQIAWNTINVGGGQTEYVNNRGGAAGGHVWYDRVTVPTGLTYANRIGLLDAAGLRIPQTITSHGSFAQIATEDRGGGGQTWIWYSTSLIARWFYVGAGDRATLDNAGNFAAVGNITAFASDARLKKNVVEAPKERTEAFFDNVSIKQFDWDQEKIEAHGIKNFQPEDNQIGALAQELREVFPAAVRKNEAMPGDILTIDWTKVVPLLVAEVQSLRARVTELEKE